MNGPDSRGQIGVGLDRKVGWGLVLEVERKVAVSYFQRQQVTSWLIYCQKWCETICLLITFYFLCCRDDQGHEEAESGNTRRSPLNYPVGDAAISKRHYNTYPNLQKDFNEMKKKMLYKQKRRVMLMYKLKIR